MEIGDRERGKADSANRERGRVGIKTGASEKVGELGGVCFFYLMLNRTFFDLNTE